MNKQCARLGLKASLFDSPHGLMNCNSRSTAFDVAKLSAKCLEDKRFREVVNTRYFVVPKRDSNSKSYRWENTHKMHGQKGVIPIKTGITNSAGPCLCTAVELETHASLIIVLLCSKDMDSRWLETSKLAKWATDRLIKIKQYKNSCEMPAQENRILQRLKHLWLLFNFNYVSKAVWWQGLAQVCFVLRVGPRN